MLSRREATAFCFAPATAPAVVAIVLGSPSPWPLAAVVAYIAAFVLGAPMYAYMRHRGWPLVVRCLLAATVAGVLAALVLLTALLLADSVSRFFADLGTVAVILWIAAEWGLGLGLVAGIVLFLLLRGSAPSPSRA